jgi:hypothetical protein
MFYPGFIIQQLRQFNIQVYTYQPRPKQAANQPMNELPSWCRLLLRQMMVTELVEKPEVTGQNREQDL